jgi:uncharacterized protein (TIGR03083 family)
MSDSRQTYAQAGEFFLAVAARIRDDQWDSPGLGVWSVRDLVGHTSGAFANVERDLASPATADRIESAAAFFAAGLAMPGIAEGIAQRGREAGAALGTDPVGAVRALADRVRALVATTPDETIVATRMGSLPLLSYLPTKTFELIVHTLDIAATLGLDVEPPPDALAESIEIAVALAVRSGNGPALLHALTGRRPLSTDFSVM